MVGTAILSHHGLGSGGHQYSLSYHGLGSGGYRYCLSNEGLGSGGHRYSLCYHVFVSGVHRYSLSYHVFTFFTGWGLIPSNSVIEIFFKRLQQRLSASSFSLIVFFLADYSTVCAVSLFCLDVLKSGARMIVHERTDIGTNIASECIDKICYSNERSTYLFT